MKETPVPAGLERRKEDYELITGRGRYVDDLKAPRSVPPRYIWSWFAVRMPMHKSRTSTSRRLVRSLALLQP